MSLESIALVLAFCLAPLLALAMRAWLARKQAAARKDRGSGPGSGSNL